MVYNELERQRKLKHSLKTELGLSNTASDKDIFNAFYTKVDNTFGYYTILGLDPHTSTDNDIYPNCAALLNKLDGPGIWLQKCRKEVHIIYETLSNSEEKNKYDKKNQGVADWFTKIQASLMK